MNQANAEKIHQVNIDSGNVTFNGINRIDTMIIIDGAPQGQGAVDAAVNIIRALTEAGDREALELIRAALPDAIEEKPPGRTRPHRRGS